ncbi:DUF4336 domain-containing protein [aff. Roholtiella sp. LEGE 12411]|uniref:DUF4336 domain-containing protein n=1 Tax=aff. Roholtiella sp. LEGE 12411 TaxID=1828822 RepID=UPI00188215F7|nr:DUF4336 domain-containing protein [aff. Roholtiella sp. LEGE 12411]MBE9034460.1 DUF4336 domain-containing protein [aff. Roholtiella sp. LEGE 12411]
MLIKIDQNIWIAEQPLKYFGLSVGTKMTVISLNNGELAVISPIQVDDETTEQLNELGNVKYIVAPNLFHYLFLSNFKALYPQAKVYAVSGLKAKRPEISIDQELEDNGENFLGELECLLFEGFKTFLPSGALPLNEYIFFHAESQTLILTDTAFYFDESFPMTTKLVSKIMGGYKKLRPSLLEQLATQEKEKVKQSVQKVLRWDFRRVIVAHGSIVEHNAKKQFKEGYEWFLGESL